MTNQSIIAELTPHARLHAERLLAAYPRLVATSGRRTAQRNRAVGGSSRSYHLAGRALDLVGDRGLLALAATWARASRVTPRCTGPEEVLIEKDHLHIAW